MIEKRLLSTKEVAAYLGVSRRQLYRLRQNPELGFPRPVKMSLGITARCFWARDRVDAWLDKAAS